MAHIRQQRDVWRAEVAKHGIRESRCFPTREAAESWASTRERKLSDRHALKRALADSTLLSKLPRRVLDAIGSVEHQHEEITRGAIPIPHVSGVYFLILSGVVVYVGQSVDVFNRISRHRRDGKVEFDSFNYIHCPTQEMDALEARYIAALMPCWNVSFGNEAGPASGARMLDRTKPPTINPERRSSNPVEVIWTCSS